ncbi:MAG: hypothetical protein KIT09_03300 [Bryobacteraceae bacterium]|nr:hypothetical protein [Bryobacteraceae bacterium]
MSENLREFEAGPDPFGVTWNVRFGWHQTAISIRHSDTVDVKFFLSDGQQEIEKVVALPHPDLIRVSQEEGRPITDPWVMRLAALHVRRVVGTGEDMEKTLLTLDAGRIRQYAAMLRTAAPAAR